MLCSFVEYGIINIWANRIKFEQINENNRECFNKANKILIDMPSTVKTQPPNDTAVINVQNNAQTSSNVYHSLLSFSFCAHPPPLPPLELNKETVCLHGAAQLSMAWFQEGPRIILKPATMIDIDTICKTLQNANNSNTFVDVLRSHKRYAQLNWITDRSYYKFWQMMLLNLAMVYSETFMNFGGPIQKM